MAVTPFTHSKNSCAILIEFRIFERSAAMAQNLQPPKLLCDLIMKGGITSGVVYPLAVCKLAEQYSFASIGGASAGAIAAATAAAAECGRRRGKTDAFQSLSRLPANLGAKGRLLSLFQADKSTAPLFHI